jgi:RNA polymerase sigma factor (sigma-70 family)
MTGQGSAPPEVIGYWTYKIGPLAEDLIQEALVRELRAKPNFDSQGQRAAWLTTTISRLLIDHRRKIGRRVAMLRRFPPSFISHITPSQSGEEVRELLDRALATLPPTERYVLLRRRTGATFSEIAEEVGKCVSSTKGIALRAVRILRKRIR